MRSRGRGFHGHWIRGVAGPGPRALVIREVSSPRPPAEVDAAEVSYLPALPAPEDVASSANFDFAEDGIGHVVEVGASNGAKTLQEAAETVVSIEVVGPGGVASNVRITHNGGLFASPARPPTTAPFGAGTAPLQPVTGVTGEGHVAPEDASPIPDTEMFEGVVHLNVSGDAGMPPVIRFVPELRRESELRLLRLAGDASDFVDIVLRLREPLPLLDLLSGIPVVSEVTAPSTPRPTDGSEPLVSVRLRDHEPTVDARVE